MNYRDKQTLIVEPGIYDELNRNYAAVQLGLRAPGVIGRYNIRIHHQDHCPYNYGGECRCKTEVTISRKQGGNNEPKG